jgi:polyisoprenoid-binding protein YceI
MKKIIKLLVITISVVTISAYTILEFNWNIDPNYSIKFKGNKAEGTFSGLTGKINFNPNDLANSLIDVTVEANTIKTGNSTKDGHAKGEDWFNVAKYPLIKFISQSFTKSDNSIVVSGNLELHGTKKQIQIPFNFSEAGMKGLFTGKFKGNRKDYGINGNFFGFTVGKEFEVTLNIPVTK